MHTPRDTRPRRYSPLLALGLLVAGALVLLALVLVLRDTLDPARRLQMYYAAERQRELDEQLSTLDTLVAAGWRVLPLVLVAGAGYVGLLALFNRIAARRAVDADKVIALAQAQHAPVPQTLTFSPHYSSRNEAPLALPEGESTPRALAAPTFAELLGNGTIAPGAPLVLGWSEQGAVTGSWRALLSTGIGGLQGSGKSTTAAALLSQAALSGARLLVVDPHAGDDDSLANRIAPLAPAFLAEPASEGRAILDVLRQARAELERRKRGSGERWPLIVVVDEWTGLLRGELADQLPPFIADLTSEGRKYNAYAFLLAQRWASSDVGGGGVRNTLAAAYVHRMRPDEARYLTGLRSAQLPADVLQLGSGESYLLDTSGTLTKVRTPLITPSDVSSVGARLALVEGTPKTPGRSSEGAPVDAPSASGSATPTSPEQARILALFSQGVGTGGIVKELWGVSGGHQYNKRRDEVEATIRAALAEVHR